MTRTSPILFAALPLPIALAALLVGAPAGCSPAEPPAVAAGAASCPPSLALTSVREAAEPGPAADDAGAMAQPGQAAAERPAMVEPTSDATDAGPLVGPMKDYPDILEFREMGASGRCGAFEVGPLEASTTAAGHPMMGVRVTHADGRLLAQYIPRLGIDSFTPTYCGDLTGDGATELVLHYTTGGAHCCHTELVVRLGEPMKPLGTFDMDDGGYATPAKLRPGKSYQLVMDDRILVSTSAPFGSFAGTPPLPMVLDYDGERYVVRTKRFPELVRKARDAMRSELGPCEPGDAYCANAWGAYLGASAYLLGDWGSARSTLSPEARAVGERVIGELRRAGR